MKGAAATQPLPVNGVSHGQQQAPTAPAAPSHAENISINGAVKGKGRQEATANPSKSVPAAEVSFPACLL